MDFTVTRGDIAEQIADCLVNAAGRSLRMGLEWPAHSAGAPTVRSTKPRWNRNPSISARWR